MWKLYEIQCPQIKFTWNTVDTLIYVLSITTLTMVVVTETSLQAKAEIFTTWFFTEKDPCFFFAKGHSFAGVYRGPDSIFFSERQKWAKAPVQWLIDKVFFHYDLVTTESLNMPPPVPSGVAFLALSSKIWAETQRKEKNHFLWFL